MNKYALTGLVAVILISGWPGWKLPQVDAAERIRLTALPMATGTDLILCEEALVLTQYKLDAARQRVKALEAELAATKAALKTTQSKLDGCRVANNALRADCAGKGKR